MEEQKAVNFEVRGSSPRRGARRKTMEKEETIFGFFRTNIRNSLGNDCLESCTNPQMFWWALQEVFHDLEEEIENNPSFWDDELENWS